MVLSNSRYWTARLPSCEPPEALHLRLPQPSSVESSPGTRGWTQRRSDVAYRQLAPDFKTIADFRRDNGHAIRACCARFVVLCRQLGPLTGRVVAVDGSRFKAVNTRDRNFTPGAIRRRVEQIEAGIERYLSMLDTADHQEDEVVELRTARLTERLETPAPANARSADDGASRRGGDRPTGVADRS
jgi:hypothetical protein